MTQRGRPAATRLTRLAIGGIAGGIALALLLVAAGTLLVDRVAAPPEPKAVAPLGVEPPSSNAFQIVGFRTAQFGMKEAELREALSKDFGVNPAALTTVDAPALGARSISFLLDGLVPGAGVAQLTYVLGFQGQDLIQISAVWGGPGRPDAGAPQIEAAAAELKRYFRSLPIDPASMSFDLPQPDGTMLLARARDRQGRVAMLIRADPLDAQGVKRSSVQLVYIRDDKHPDVFRIKKGQF